MVIGDKVRIINYGHAIWLNKGDDLVGCVLLREMENKDLIDIHPELVGREGVIQHVRKLKGEESCYSLSGISGKTAWYAQEQLEKI